MRGPLLRLTTPALLAVLSVVQIRHSFHGPRVDYLGVAAAAIVGWLGVPGVGEATLIAAGVLAAHGRLDISEVVIVAWAGATAGGIAGWLVGLKGGRRLVTAWGPPHRWRLSMLRGGERFFARRGMLAVFFVPAWVAGIHGMRWGRYLPANAAAALAWALLVGVGSYAIGPSIGDLASDLGLAGAAILGIVALVGVMARRRSRDRP